MTLASPAVKRVELMQQWQSLSSLVVVAGHAVYLGQDFLAPAGDQNWWLQEFQKGEPPLYLEHIRHGVELAASHPDALLVFGGGQTRRDAGPRSEGQSYWMLADHFSWWGMPAVRERATTEEFGRDSFENILFGIARFRECTGRYPQCVEMVGWEFKRARFDFHRRTIRWPAGERHYRYHGVNNPADILAAVRGEADTLAAFQLDPFATESGLWEKRLRRNPFARQHGYAQSCPEIARLLAHRSMDGKIYGGDLPW